jgi:hypothetical protein
VFRFDADNESTGSARILKVAVLPPATGAAARKKGAVGTGMDKAGKERESEWLRATLKESLSEPPSNSRLKWRC